MSELGRSPLRAGALSTAGTPSEGGQHRVGHLPGTDLAWVGAETPPMSDLPAEVEVGTAEVTDALLEELDV